MKVTDLTRFFVQKMSFELRMRAKHDDYQVRLTSSKIIPLPSLLTLSRGSGEISLRNLKGLAENLGLTLRAMEDAARCHLRRISILVCLTAHLLEHGLKRVIRLGCTPNWDEEMLLRVIESAELLLDEAMLEDARDLYWQEQEWCEIERVKQSLGESYTTFLKHIELTASHPQLTEIIDCWHHFVDEHAKSY